MESLKEFYYETDRKITRWMARYGILLLRLSVGIVIGSTVRGGGMVAEPELAQPAKEAEKS
jgi:hypothetical protein